MKQVTSVTSPDLPAFIRQLQQLLYKRNLVAVGAGIGVHPVTLRRFRASGKGLSATNMDKLANFLGVEIVVIAKVTLPPPTIAKESE